ncbi:hypothetical protein CGGC5_v013100 [Colletotrichum fructicola Nara gc5]|uniref:Uncharacterized protein n=1 Tax=Colletotrichum fructicola (strain Nara gc5) TaxID=1213859 RepID=A0A7J6ILF1_COLFN|nr:hypothetical protein CGGC5_v013100 [Colletotrichum fructicola Nara gc5]
MAPQLVDDAICCFNRFSEATSPGILRELIENADWNESLQRFCDSDPGSVVKIAWSMIDMCSSNSHVNEFKNPDLRPFNHPGTQSTSKQVLPLQIPRYATSVRKSGMEFGSSPWITAVAVALIPWD